MGEAFGVAPKIHLLGPVHFKRDHPNFVFGDDLHEVVFAGQDLFLNGWREEKEPKVVIDLR